jgi:hypothetical protein
MISAQTRSAFVARENRYPPRIKCGAGFFRIMLYDEIALAAMLTISATSAVL